MTFPELVALLESMAEVPSEETAGLSELDHGLQCAFELSRRHPGDGALHVAGLVHDVGHRFGSEAAHGARGAAELRPLFGDRVAGLVAAHVPAKRYLVTTDPAYRARLSDDSVRTLGLQGGPLTDAQLARFEASPYAEDAVALRRADDDAKEPGRNVPALDTWMPVLRRWARPAPSELR
jgi:predicted HD phosphohydrolase